LAVGCDEVEDRLAWSPDAKQAVLRVEDKLYVMDTNGQLSDIVASNVTGAAWLPDSRGLVLTRLLTVDKWRDAESLLPTREIDAVQTLARSLLALGAEGAEQFEPTRAGYHLLLAHILQKKGKTADAAKLASYVAERWSGPRRAILLVAGAIWTRPASWPVKRATGSDCNRRSPM